MRFRVAAEDIFDELARTHWDGTDEDPLSATGFVGSAVERIGYILDPLFFFGAIGEDEFQGAGGSCSFRLLGR